MITLSDVRNERAKIQALMDEGLPAIQALIRGLGAEFAHQYVLDEHNRLVHLLFFHRTSLQNLHRWPYTFQLDLTYNTERFGLKLLQVVGSTSENESFIIGQAYLSSEDTESIAFVLDWLRDYYIQMNLPPPTTIILDASKAIMAALRRTWPGTTHILCLWHITRM
jgi:hypothetical protein